MDILLFSVVHGVHYAHFHALCAETVKALRLDKMHILTSVYRRGGIEIVDSRGGKRRFDYHFSYSHIVLMNSGVIF